MECVAYLRVSTERQAEEGNGLESQRRDIENYARKNELIVTDWYIDDGYTGTNMDRPQLQRLINDCSKKRVHCVVAYKLDRISRSMIDGLYVIERIFQKNGVDFRCVHDSVSYGSPMEQAYTQMMAVFAQLDRNTMLLRMRGGLLERIKQGYWRGGGNLPYCYSYDPKEKILSPIPERAEQANQALDLFIKGYSDKKIMEILGYPNEQAVRSILTNRVNIGMLNFNGILYKGSHKPIFDAEKFELALRLRDARRNAKNYEKRGINLLSGFLYCGVCNCKMAYQTCGKPGSHKKIYCYSRNHALRNLPNWNESCDNDPMWADDLERVVIGKILQISIDLTNSKKPERENKSELLASGIKREREKLKRLYTLYADGNDTVIEVIRGQEKKIVEMESQLVAERDKEMSPKDQEFVYENIKTLVDVWGSINKYQQHDILKIIISKIVITHGNVDIILRNF